MLIGTAAVLWRVIHILNKAGLIFREEIAVLPGSHRLVQQQVEFGSSMSLKYLGLVCRLNSVVILAGVQLGWCCQRQLMALSIVIGL